ncbi:MAG: BREX-1 system phosphatase PglZ type A, partial [Bacillota bacterium]
GERKGRNKEKRKIRKKVENLYSNWYLNKLAVNFSESLVDEESWSISGVRQQNSFYNAYINNFITENEKVFVIISDGLRYEAAAELEQILKSSFKSEVNLSALQGSIPSTTSIGMASTLPHKELKINEKQEIFVDGQKTKSTQDKFNVLRNEVIKSNVLKARKALNMITDELREEIYGKDLIYIYHDTIDAIGDNFKTEDEVFDAVDKALDEIRLLIKSLISKVSATNIIITADHGFIYRRGDIQASDKTKKDHSNNEKESRRYIITNDKEEPSGSISKPLNYLFTDTDLKAVVPKGANRFQISGPGLKYVHGGAALQEIVIPVIKFKNDRSKSSKNIAEKVDIKITNINKKITNSIFHLEFFQTEKVAEKILPRSLILYFINEKGEKISNENMILADSRSSDPEDRTYKERFTLKNIEYNKNQNYYLIMEDKDEDVEKEYARIPFKINLIINQDFDF